ncbi:hypothetical protein STRATTON_20 [Erwinia phage vB_EamM_Stratton]|uniref:Uncharacterized protein n=2 Tax=Erskinevirus EaH2 TaxID=2169883 RepID=A0A1B2IGT4_9CAUD|nr:hypothetical protein G173_gp189 [Erwinia phage phiEaH2]AFQ96734.1 hypothetical protein [Erwinia phage phiEaH2]ANZ50445.1 hypothetical protein STRATTON_20 [Erwinia phage vB_EamM_Stratton]
MPRNYRPTAASAIDGLVAAHYSREEATMIRPFLPLHFDNFVALPSANYEFWSAYRAVQDALTYDRHKFRFYFWRDEEKSHIPNSPYVKMYYESPTFKAEFSTIEFIRHFGRALFTDHGSDGLGRKLNYVNGGLRIKTRILRELFDEIGKETDNPAPWFNGYRRPTISVLIPPQPTVFTPREVLIAWRAGERVHRTLHGGRFDRKQHWINPMQDGWDIARYLDLQAYRESKGFISSQEFHRLRSDVITVLTATDIFPAYTMYHRSLILNNHIFGESIDPTGYQRLDLPAVDNVHPIGYLTPKNNYSVTMPSDVFSMFTPDEWHAVL